MYVKIRLYLPLVNLSVMSGWISSNYMSWGNGGMRRAPHCWKPCYWSPFLLWDSFWAPVITVPQPGCVCVHACHRIVVCVCVCAYSFVRMCCTKFCSVCVCEWVRESAVTRMTRWELKARLSAGSEFLKQVPAHLVVIGRRKKGPCVLGTGSKTLTQPFITQPCTVQNQPKLGGGNTNSSPAPLQPSLLILTLFQFS